MSAPADLPPLPAANLLTTNRKALVINLDDSRYGTFAEIGAGQEVARYFFQAGGAAGTVAKTMSAYDMKFSDEIYGKARRYVSRERLLQMLEHEYRLLLERLTEQRGPRTQFFAFADTVAAVSFKGGNESHGWMGIRFQRAIGGPAHDILLHVRMLDRNNPEQQQALGVVGVNLTYGAVYFDGNLSAFVQSLADNVGEGRIEIDMLEFHGPDFARIDNRLVSLKLVELGLTDAVLFGPQHEVLQPSEAFYKKGVLIERGSFRPVTHVNIDMMQCTQEQLADDETWRGVEVLPIMEMTLNNLRGGGQGAVQPEDFLARVDAIATLGYRVLVSNYFEFYRLSAYFRRYTQQPIGIVLGINTLLDIFNERYYENLPGGILEAFGRLFKAGVRLYVYPMLGESFYRYVQDRLNHAVAEGDHLQTPAGALITVHSVRVASHLRHLYQHLLESRCLEPVYSFRREHMRTYSRDALKQILAGEGQWEHLVPAPVAALIKERHLWGFQPAAVGQPGPAGAANPVAATTNG